jgi:hypothetical protein
MHALTEAMRAKGYTAREVAKRWGYKQPHSLSLVAKNPGQKDWDAVAGLPDKTEGMSK